MRLKATRGRTDLERLARAVTSARTALTPFREARAAAVRAYAGHRWGGEGYEEVPVNLLALYVRIITQNLVAKNPRFMLSVLDKKHKPAVEAMQTWMDREVERMGLARVLRRAVHDALSFLGVVKVGLATPQDAAVTGWTTRAGTPFAEVVDLDDFVFDHHARQLEEASFVGHRTRKPLEVVREFKQFSRRRRELQPDYDPFYNEDGDERVGVLGRGFEGNDDEFDEMVTLWEIYIPRKKLVLTLESDQGGGPAWEHGALWEREWVGPDEGPFHYLYYGLVPGNAMPKGPMTDLIDLAGVANESLRKLIRQAARLKKTLPFFNPEDVKKLADAGDGEAFACDRPDALKELVTGGPDPNLTVFFDAIRQIFDYMAGNLSILGGLSPQSKTATQDKMLNENSSRSVLDMQAETSDFARRVGKSLLWFHWHHPEQVVETTYSPAGLPEFTHLQRVHPFGATDPATGRPRTLRRDAPWRTMDLKIDPYSLRAATPEGRAQALTALVTQVLAPMLPLLQQQGISLDLNAFLNKIARYQDMPDLPEIATVISPPEHGPGGDPGGAHMPSATQRTYTRENMPGRSEKGDMMNRANALLGIDTGGSPAAAQGAQPQR